MAKSDLHTSFSLLCEAMNCIRTIRVDTVECADPKMCTHADHMAHRLADRISCFLKVSDEEAKQEATKKKSALFNKLLPHVGHQLATLTYFKREPGLVPEDIGIRFVREEEIQASASYVSIECENCNEVILSAEKEGG